jgi:hypothetical protein
LIVAAFSRKTAHTFAHAALGNAIILAKPIFHENNCREGSVAKARGRRREGL